MFLFLNTHIAFVLTDMGSPSTQSSYPIQQIERLADDIKSISNSFTAVSRVLSGIVTNPKLVPGSSESQEARDLQTQWREVQEVDGVHYNTLSYYDHDKKRSRISGIPYGHPGTLPAVHGHLFPVGTLSSNTRER